MTSPLAKPADPIEGAKWHGAVYIMLCEKKKRNKRFHANNTSSDSGIKISYSIVINKPNELQLVSNKTNEE